MKIYNEITIDMKTLEVVGEDSFEYTGPLALACGGGSPPDPPKPPPPPKPLKDVTASTNTARANQKAKARKSMGQQSTLMTGGLGMDEKAKTSTKKLLGG